MASLLGLAIALAVPSAAHASLAVSDAPTGSPAVAVAAAPDLTAPIASSAGLAAPGASDLAAAALLADPSPILSARAPLDQWTLAQADTSAAPIPPAQSTLDPNDPARTGINPYSPYIDRKYSLLQRIGSVKWELAAGIAFFTATNLSKDLKHGRGFHFEDEGWFGDGTANLGVDKAAHAFNAALISDILYYRMERKVGGGVATAATAAGLGMFLQLYGEVYDGFEEKGGWSWQDVAMDAIGSGFSFIRNAVPGLRDKLDFRILITPNSHFYTPTGKAHFEQQRFLLALKLSGFEGLKRSPLRFVELHAGYYATGFTTPQRQRGEPLRQRPFIGIGINLQELFFPHPTGWLSKAVRTTLEYLQPPYTALSVDSHGHVSY